MLQKGFNFMAWVQYGKTQYPQWIASLLVEKFCNLTSRVLYWVSKVLIKGKSSKVLLLFFVAYQIVSLSLSDTLELLMCGFKCLGFFTIYIIIEYLLIFIGCFYHHNSALIAIVKLTLIFSMGVSFVIIIIGFGILILCSKKISLTYFCATIQYCEMYLLLIEIEHSYYELFFATPLIFYFLHLLVFYGAKKLESPEVEQLNNSDHSITRISGEISQWPFMESGLYDFYDIGTAQNSVLSQPPSYDEVMKKDSTVMINMESDTEPPSYFEASLWENITKL